MNWSSPLTHSFVVVLFGIGNICGHLWLVLQAIITRFVFPACLFPFRALSKFGSVTHPEQRLPQQDLLV